MDKHRQAVTAYEKILKSLSPVYAKESERDEAINTLSQQVDSIQNALSRLETLLTRHENN